MRLLCMMAVVSIGCSAHTTAAKPLTSGPMTAADVARHEANTHSGGPVALSVTPSVALGEDLVVTLAVTGDTAWLFETMKQPCQERTLDVSVQAPNGETWTPDNTPPWVGCMLTVEPYAVTVGSEPGKPFEFRWSTRQPLHLGTWTQEDMALHQADEKAFLATRARPFVPGDYTLILGAGTEKWSAPFTVTPAI